jgi:hypothetical protein
MLVQSATIKARTRQHHLPSDATNRNVRIYSPRFAASSRLINGDSKRK